MIVGIGVDVCEVGRMTGELRREGGGFRDQVFTPDEIAYCESRRNRAQHYAARFAAKEAAVKALGVAGSDTATWREAEVRLGPGGSRCLVLHARLARAARSRGVRRVHLSLTHDRTCAIANVVLEADETVAGTEVERVE